MLRTLRREGEPSAHEHIFSHLRTLKLDEATLTLDRCACGAVLVQADWLLGGRT